MMSKDNMEEKKHPFLEQPETLDPTEKNNKDLQKGGGGE